MTPDRLPPRMRPRPPFEVRYPPSTHVLPGAATRNNLPVNGGQQPSTRPHPAAPPCSLWHRTYLSPIQSHPHSTVLSHSTAKPQTVCRGRPTRTESILANGHFPRRAVPCSHPSARKPCRSKQFYCQVSTYFSITP